MKVYYTDEKVVISHDNDYVESKSMTLYWLAKYLIESAVPGTVREDIDRHGRTLYFDHEMGFALDDLNRWKNNLVRGREGGE